MQQPAQPTLDFSSVLAAAARIAGLVNATPVLRSRSLDALAGATLWFKAEHLQRTGAFKFRGASNAVRGLSPEIAARGVATHSSGNHGAALALAACQRGIPCHVVVPEDAVPAKVQAILRYGGTVHRCAAGTPAREAACAGVVESTGATLVHPYTHPDVIAGQATATLELMVAQPGLDALVVPLGGGGLAAGAALALSGSAPRCALWLAEPDGADDGARAFARGHVEGLPHTNTVCDGLRGTLGTINFDILRNAGARVLVQGDEATLAAQALLNACLKQVVEPSSAIALAAVLGNPGLFAGRRVGIVLSGGNVAAPHGADAAASAG